MAAYLVAGVSRVSDPSGFEHWRAQVAPLVAQYGGTFLAAASSEHVEGEWRPIAMAIIAFPTMDDLRQCYNSVEHPELAQLRQRSVVGDIVIVDGV